MTDLSDLCQNSTQPSTPSWRTHSCVQRSHSCERVFACQPNPQEAFNQ